MRPHHIVLIGYRGTGKTTIGKDIANSIGIRFIDTDEEIERRAGKSIPDIFEQEGEKKFREFERGVIADLPNETCVISTGGGAVLDQENVKQLKKGSGVVFWLKADADTIFMRTCMSERPALTSLSLRDEIADQLDKRTPVYRSVADYCIDTTDFGVQDAGTEIRDIYFTGGNSSEKRGELVAVINSTGIFDQEKLTLVKSLSDPRLRLFGIFGYPCRHSRSPDVFNPLFKKYGLNAHYTRIEHQDTEEIIYLSRKSGVRGLSVTIPHKENVIPYMDWLSEDAKAIGAVNTVLLLDKKTYGYNTDWIGIRNALSCSGCTGKKACVIGAGGAAVAAVYAVQNLGFEVTVLNRTVERAKAVSERFSCEAGSLDEFGDCEYDLLINSTPVGMEPDTNTPVPVDLLKPGMTVFDIVYTPPETPLIKAAKSRGCNTVSGIEMFVHQLVEQFRLFTGISVSADDVRGMLMS